MDAVRNMFLRTWMACGKIKKARMERKLSIKSREEEENQLQVDRIRDPNLRVFNKGKMQV